ncbi:hypothetical protein BH11CYA1_BH11CYA1_41260 [soil metagenome]
MSEPVLHGNDLVLIESLVFDSSLKPTYSAIRNHLMWADEMPDGLTPDGYTTLCNLWIARSFIHRGLDFSSHPVDPEYITNFWNRALEQKFKWTGFERLSLSEEDRAYYDSMIEKAEQGALF